MLGFFSKEKDSSKVVKKEDIYFVSCKDDLTLDEIKANFNTLAISFAKKLNVYDVFLHIGKEIIHYEYKV